MGLTVMGMEAHMTILDLIIYERKKEQERRRRERNRPVLHIPAPPPSRPRDDREEPLRHGSCEINFTL